MSYKPGDLVRLAITPEPIGASGSVYAYVWRTWDSAIQVGTTPYTTKQLSMGGDPTNGDRLIYTCMPVMVDGQSGSLVGSLVADNAPVVQDVTISRNDDYYGFWGTLALTAYSLDAHVLAFRWFEGATLLADTDVTVPGGLAFGGWRGNDTAVEVLRSRFVNRYVTQVNSDKVLTCEVKDAVTGVVTYVDFRLRGLPVPALGALLVADANSVTTDASSLAVQRIGTDQWVTFVAYVTDIDGKKPAFTWDFAGSRAWTVPYYGAGTDAQLPDGSFSSTFAKSLAGETVASGLAKTATALCRIVGTDPGSRSQGQYTNVSFSVTLLKNNAPTATVISCWNAVNNAPVPLTATIQPGTLMLGAVSTDPDLDVVNQFWEITNYPGGSHLYLYGPKVIFSTLGYSATAVKGQVTSTDRMGGVLVTPFEGPHIA